MYKQNTKENMAQKRKKCANQYWLIAGQKNFLEFPPETNKYKLTLMISYVRLSKHLPIVSR
jgi:hypothetical protein